jgi:hypothetical protein
MKKRGGGSRYVLWSTYHDWSSMVARALDDLGGRLRPSINNYTINRYFLK